jgi:hypothetical protein
VDSNAESSAVTVTITVNATACYVYGVDDAGDDDTQFFTYDTTAGAFQALGPLQPGQNIEGLDIHPTTGVLYGSAGFDNEQGQRGFLFSVDWLTGALTPVGSTRYSNVVALSFRPSDASLWGWSNGRGLIRIDIGTGRGTLELSSIKLVNGLAWNNDSSLLYAMTGWSLYVYDPSTGRLTLHDLFVHLPNRAEALEFRPDGLLMIGVHGSTTIYAYNVNTKELVPSESLVTPYDDVEGLAWPAQCTP